MEHAVDRAEARAAGRDHACHRLAVRHVGADSQHLRALLLQREQPAHQPHFGPNGCRSRPGLRQLALGGSARRLTSASRTLYFPARQAARSSAMSPSPPVMR